MSEFYVNNPIVVRFITYKDGKPTPSRYAYVKVYAPNNKFLIKESAMVDGVEVRYVLAEEFVTIPGKYTFMFRIELDGLPYTHQVEEIVDTLSLPQVDSVVPIQEV